jgi:hypothetical protein
MSLKKVGLRHINFHNSTEREEGPDQEQVTTSPDPNLIQADLETNVTLL